MASRSLNKVILIGNLTRDPELRYTPQGTAVCTIGLATNRSWTTEAGEKREETEFHRLVAWNKLAELCAQLLTKGRKIYVEGRLQTRSWTAQDGGQRTTTEIVIDDMILLDSKKPAGASLTETEVHDTNKPESLPAEEVPVESEEKADQSSLTSKTPTDDGKKKRKTGKSEDIEEEKDAGEVSTPQAESNEELKEEVSADDIPF